LTISEKFEQHGVSADDASDCLVFELRPVDCTLFITVLFMGERKSFKELILARCTESTIGMGRA